MAIKEADIGLPPVKVDLVSPASITHPESPETQKPVTLYTLDQRARGLGGPPLTEGEWREWADQVRRWNGEFAGRPKKITPTP
jgi:hypothetical protein